MLRRLLPEHVSDDWRDPSGRVVVAELPLRSAVDRPHATSSSNCEIGTPRRGRQPLRRRLHPDGEQRRAGRRRRAHGRSAPTTSNASAPSSPDPLRGTDEGRHRRSRQGRLARSPPSSRATATTCWSSTATPARHASCADGVKVLVGDACEIAVLEDAALQDCQVVIAATGDDKANLVVSLLAKTEYGVPRVVARVNHPSNEWMFNESLGRRRLGVDPAHPQRAGRGGGHGRRRRAAVHAAPGQRQPGRAHAAGRLPGGRARRSDRSPGRRTACWSPSCAAAR